MSWEEELKEVQKKAKGKILDEGQRFRDIKDDTIGYTNSIKWLEENKKHLQLLEDDEDKKSE
jgi:hypothetical protein